MWCEGELERNQAGGDGCESVACWIKRERGGGVIEPHTHTHHTHPQVEVAIKTCI